MAWERRGNQKFYYRSRKINGRVVREYLGRGDRAKRADLEDAQRRETREKERAEGQTWEAMDEHIAQLHQLTKLLSHSYLVNAGFYQHHRGEWRRRGENSVQTQIQHYFDHPEDFQAVIKAAMEGDKSVMTEVKAILDALPQWAEELGNLVSQTENKVLDIATGNNLLKREATKRDLDVRRQRLSEPSYVEKLLQEQIVLDLYMLQRTRERALDRNDQHSDKLLTGAHKRFLASVKCLEQIRKLVPPVRINIAENQINMG
jgi:hypothetical protein